MNDDSLPGTSIFMIQVRRLRLLPFSLCSRRSFVAQFWTFILSRSSLLRGLNHALSDTISPTHDRYAKQNRKHFAALIKRVANLTPDVDEGVTWHPSLDMDVHTNPWSHDMVVRTSAQQPIVLRAITDLALARLPPNIPQEGHTADRQGRDFTHSAREAYPQLRMLRLAAGTWSTLTRAPDRATHASAVVALFPYADFIYRQVVLPSLRIHQVYDFRCELERFLRHYSRPRLPPPGSTVPDGMKRHDKGQCWLFWDWDTVDDDLESIHPPTNLRSDADLKQLEDLAPALDLARLLQKSIDDIGETILQSVAAQYSFSLTTDALSRGRLHKPGPLWEDLREPYDALMRVRPITFPRYYAL